MKLAQFNAIFTNNKFISNKIFNRNIVAILSFFLFLFANFVGFANQYKSGIALDFSFTNWVIFAIDVLYIINLSQYFLLNDTAFFYYALYLVINIYYFHNVVFFGEKNNLQNLEFPHDYFFEITLFLSYYLYAQFTLYFLNLKKSATSLGKKIRISSQLYLFIVFLDFFLSLFPINRATSILFILLLVACIIIGFYAITNIIVHLKTRLARIFIAGTICFYVGSIIGFLFTMNFLVNPFSNVLMKNWTFFTETGTLLEVIFFSTGLAYRMRLVEVEKFKVEQELLKEKLKELEYKNALLQQRESISHDLHDDVGATLNSISVYSEIAKKQINNTNVEAEKTLSNIREASTHLIDTVNDIVWSVSPKNDVFENITSKMRFFAADLLVQNDVTLYFYADDSLNALN